VQLRAVLWLLLAVFAGTTIGFRVGLPGSDSTPVTAPAGVAQTDEAALAFAPPGGRRVIPKGLVSGHPTATPGLRALSDGEAETLAAQAIASAEGAPAIAFNAPRALTFMAAGDGAPATSTPLGDGSTSPDATTTTTTTPSGPPPEISSVRTLSLTPFSATISWRTSVPTSSRLVYGLDAPLIWTAPTAVGTQHEATMSGLNFSSSYVLYVTATAQDGQSAVADYLLTTPAVTGPVHVTTEDGVIRYDGQPAFPRMVWDQCTDAVAGNLAVGIDLFMGNGCGSGAQLASWLGSSAFVLADARDDAKDRSGSVGTHLPDEWDTHMPDDLTSAQAEKLVPRTADSGPRFLTLTNHFYNRAEPLPQGRGMYPALVSTADVVGFDLYPLQNWCRYDSFHDVFDSQLDLVALARGKPTFQWIEARQMDCFGAQLEPTPETLRAEAWLSIAGGAHAIGYFPNNWNAAVGAEISRTNREIQALIPALVEPGIAASSSLGSFVKVGARDHNGAVYVIAVNASRTPTTSTITVPALGDRMLRTLDGQHSVLAAGGSFTDSFGPLEARIYIASPSQ
jgi:hypothetical protein